MAEFKLTVVDDTMRRVTCYLGWSAPLLVASKNPRTIKEFERIHNRLIGRFVGQLYLEQRVSQSFIDGKDLTRAKLQSAVSTHELPYDALEKYSLQELLELAKQPDYQDYKPNQRVGTGIKPRKEVAYDGVMVIDLRTYEILIRGWRESYMNFDEETEEITTEPPPGKEGEPRYRWFGYLSDIRKGYAGFARKHRGYFEGCGKSIEYELGPEWTIVDLKTGRRF